MRNKVTGLFSILFYFLFTIVLVSCTKIQFFFIEILDKLRLFIDFSEKYNFHWSAVSRLESKFMTTWTDLLDFLLELAFLCLERVHVKNLDSNLKPSMSSMTYDHYPVEYFSANHLPENTSPWKYISQNHVSPKIHFPYITFLQNHIRVLFTRITLCIINCSWMRCLWILSPQDACGSYLSGRIQKIRIGDAVSKDIKVTSGAPQGSHLGPLCFIWFVNKISETFVRVLFYADDMKLFLPVSECLKIPRLFENSVGSEQTVRVVRQGW
jgi:hypothetical protein